MWTNWTLKNSYTETQTSLHGFLIRYNTSVIQKLIIISLPTL